MALSTGRRLTELVERLSRLVMARLHADGLAPAQWQALRYLARANRFSRSPKALTLYLGATKGTVSQTLMALERRGLVAKCADAEDRRAVRIELTEAGRVMLGGDPLADLGGVLAGLPGVRRRRLESDLELALARIVEDISGRPFGVCADCRHFRRGDGPSVHRCRLLGADLGEADSRQICVEQEPRTAAEA